MTDAPLSAAKPIAMSPALIWALTRGPLVLAVVFLLRHPLLNLVERVFDITGVTLFVMDLATTPVSRLLLVLAASAVFFAAAKLAERQGGWKAYAASVALVAAVAFAAAAVAGGGLKLVAIVTSLAAFNWATMSLLTRAGLTTQRLNLVIASVPLVSEALFTSRHLSWVKQSMRGETSPAHAEHSSKWPGAMLAALALAVLVPGEKLVAAETAMRASPDVRKFAEGDFNGLAFDAADKTLFATGHGQERVLAFNTDDVSAESRKASADTGFAQGIEYSPARGEFYVYNEPLRAIQVFDAATLTLKEAIPAPVSPGDSWIVFEPISGALIVSSEADKQEDVPLLVIDRDSGAILDRRREEAGNIMAHPDAPIVYLTFFRRFSGVVAYDATAKTIVATAPTDARMDRMAFDVKHDEVLIASPAEGRVQRFDAKSLSPKGAFSSIFGVRVIAIDETRNALLVASLATGKVALMDLTKRTVVRTWYVGPWLRSIVLAPERGIAYISSKGGLYELRYARVS